MDGIVWHVQQDIRQMDNLICLQKINNNIMRFDRLVILLCVGAVSVQGRGEVKASFKCLTCASTNYIIWEGVPVIRVPNTGEPISTLSGGV